MKLHKTIITAFIITLMVGVATASTADLTIFPKESTAEINSFTSYEVEIENIGTVKDVYSISSTSSEIDIAPRKVELEPEQSETVNLWYNPSTGMDEGKYGFTVTASSRATGERYNVDGVAKVIKDHNVVMETVESKTGCLGQDVVYSVEVKNEGIQPETFRIKSNAGSLSDNQLTLQEGESRDVELQISSDTPVERTINVVAASTTTYAKDTKELQFKVETCYDSEMEASESSLELPAKKESKLEFTLQNTGTKSDNFTVESNIGEVEDSERTIESGESETVEVYMTPQDVSTQDLTVTATSNVQSSVTTTVESYNGMNSNVNLDPETVNVCEQQSKEIDVNVGNTGEAEEDFSLSSNIGELGESSVSLAPEESKTTDLELDGSEFEEGTQNQIEVTSTASSFGEPSSTAEGTFNVQNCWDLEMNIIPRVASAGENRSSIYEIQLENPGTKKNTYELSYEAPPWVTLEPNNVTVQPGETEKAFIYAGVPFQKKGEVRITAKAVGKQVEETEEVKLLLGKDITEEELEEAVKDEEKEVETEQPSVTERITGQASSAFSQTGKVVGSIVVGALVTIGVLFS